MSVTLTPDVSMGNVLLIVAVVVWATVMRIALWRVDRTLESTNKFLGDIIAAMLGLTKVAREMQEDNKAFADFVAGRRKEGKSYDG